MKQFNSLFNYNKYDLHRNLSLMFFILILVLLWQAKQISILGGGAVVLATTVYVMNLQLLNEQQRKMVDC